MLSDCPKSGEGVNDWVNRRVLQLLRKRKSTEEIIIIVKQETKYCGRDTLQDILHSLNTAPGFLASPRKPNSTFVYDLDLEEQKDQLEVWTKCDRQWWLNEWKEANPGSAKEGEAQILREMFRGANICIGKNRFYPEIIHTEQLTSVNLSEYQFIVPNPMVEEFGLTKEGKLSKRCLGNVKRRKYLVVEFDKVKDIDHQCRLHMAIKARCGGLVMLIFSGNKSVHGWYCASQMELTNWKLMQYAIWIGADPSTWPVSQWVRIPGGINEKTKQKQEVIFYDKRFIYAPSRPSN